MFPGPVATRGPALDPPQGAAVLHPDAVRHLLPGAQRVDSALEAHPGPDLGDGAVHQRADVEVARVLRALLLDEAVRRPGHRGAVVTGRAGVATSGATSFQNKQPQCTQVGRSVPNGPQHPPPSSRLPRLGGLVPVPQQVLDDPEVPLC